MEDEALGREANKICGVCGDRALGYNFNAVSCESCKAFFRRNALKNKDFRCPFSENCAITTVTRRFCQKCRLDKCFSVGMRKEYIMSEEDKVLKRQKIEQNRAKKRPQSEAPKTPKMKRESLDDCSFDETTASVASVSSETYIWDSDRKYTDLDGNRQQAVDSSSPVTAASVPSPSSPPDSASIAGSKTLDMLKESKHDESPGHCSAKYEQSSSGYEHFEESYRQQARLTDHSPDTMKYDNVSPRLEETRPSSAKTGGPVLSSTKFYHKMSRFRSSTKFDNITPRYTKYDRLSNSSKNEQSSHHINQSPSSTHSVAPTAVDESDISLTCPSLRIEKAEQTICEPPKEACPKQTSLASKFMQDPNLIAKLLSNPTLAAKIFQNQGLIAKIMTDTETVMRLASDPQITRFMEENDVVTSTAESTESQSHVKSEAEFNKTLANNGISDNMIRHMLQGDHKQVENPILTNLITNRKATECKNQIEEPGTSSDWEKSTEDVTRDVLQEVIRIPIAANSIESILYEAIKLEFSAYSTLGGNQNSRELNDAERAKLNELIVANKALLTPLDDDITNLVGEHSRFKGNSGQSDPMLLDVINLTAIAIRRLIKMSKKINAFKNMCQEDQLALLKGGCTEMMILRSAINYDPDKDMWKIPHSQERMSNIKVDVLKEAKGNLYSEHARFVRTFDPRWRDENIILILSAIALFTPDRPKVIHSDVIKLEQNSYYYLLRRYLESVYPGCEAKSTFLKLIQKISELHRLNDEVVGVYLNVNPSSVEPLLIEIFDLKH